MADARPAGDTSGWTREQWAAWMHTASASDLRAFVERGKALLAGDEPPPLKLAPPDAKLPPVPPRDEVRRSTYVPRARPAGATPPHRVQAERVKAAAKITPGLEGAVLRALRQGLGLSERAAAAALDMSRGEVERIERDKRIVNHRRVAMVAAYGRMTPVVSLCRICGERPAVVTLCGAKACANAANRDRERARHQERMREEPAYRERVRAIARAGYWRNKMRRAISTETHILTAQKDGGGTA